MSIMGFVVVGDRTSHGGVVLTGESKFQVRGQPAAHVGSQVWCPRCKRMTLINSSKFPTMTAHGKTLTFDQDTTDCGAVLYSRNNNLSGAGEREANEPLPSHAEQALDFQEHFTVQDPTTGQALASIYYKITTGEGTVFEGYTDPQGRTDVVWSKSPLPIAVEVDTNKTQTQSEDPYHQIDTHGEDH
jgi:uncharacterized Zn-binding protein involved in type VI secretion